MTRGAAETRPVVLVVNDNEDSLKLLLLAAEKYDSGRLGREFEFTRVGCYPELRTWYQENRGRFVSLLVLGVAFSRTDDDRRLVDYPDVLRAGARISDRRAVQGFLVYAYLRQEDVDRISPVLFTSGGIDAGAMTDLSSLLMSPGYGNCAFITGDREDEEHYSRVCAGIDTHALRPLDAARRRYWRERHHMVVGRSRRMTHLASEIERIGPADATVLLLGSPGVGKELVANALHRSSPRHDNELRRYPLTVNMAALDKNLIEDELFGHDRGAFTGAQEERAGILEAAQRSTVLLDEIGELDQDTQTKLLRAIEYRRVKRIGSSRETEVDIRIIATTNRSIQDLQSRFRPDFYARLAQHCIPVPSLRERWLDAPELVVQQDINEIFDYVIDQMNRDPRHKRALTIEAAAAGFMRQLIHQYINHVNDIFDGNLRALRNIIERAYERAQYDASPEITLGHIIPPLGIVRMLNIKPEAHLRTQATIEQLVGSLNLAAIERKAIVEALTKTGRNHSQAAQLLGVHRDTLRRKVTEYGID